MGCWQIAKDWLKQAWNKPIPKHPVARNERQFTFGNITYGLGIAENKKQKDGDSMGKQVMVSSAVPAVVAGKRLKGKKARKQLRLQTAANPLPLAADPAVETMIASKGGKTKFVFKDKKGQAKVSNNGKPAEPVEIQPAPRQVSRAEMRMQTRRLAIGGYPRVRITPPRPRISR